MLSARSNEEVITGLIKKVTVINLAEEGANSRKMAIKYADMATQVLDKYEARPYSDKVNLINKKDVGHISIHLDLSPRVDPPFSPRNVVEAYGELTYDDARILAYYYAEKTGEQFFVVERKLEDQPEYFKRL